MRARFPLAVMLVLGLAATRARAGAAADSALADTTTASAHAGMDHAGMHHGMDMGGHAMRAMYGRYPATREASGTAWQPDVSRHDGVHVVNGGWQFMFHGFADIVYDHQGGPRGDEKTFSDNMVMAMASRVIGPSTLGLRTMVSLEPSTIGQDGYPLLLQTGETADGKTPLIDRQHPHDLFMELSGSLSFARENNSLFFYGALPGEPALGPPAFMHRFSGVNMPLAPITHHWLDSSHITYGVLTAGVVVGPVKLEASSFRGREPDEYRWDIEPPRFDSYSGRLSVNPNPHWAFQVSGGRLESPEPLEPGVDQKRWTASAIAAGAWGGMGHWQGMLAWGQDQNLPGHTLNAYTVEGALALDTRHTVFARAEHVQKDELFVEPDPLAGRVFGVGEFSAGYRYDFASGDFGALGLGAAGTLSWIPEDAKAAYGDHPVAVVVFLRAALR